MPLPPPFIARVSVIHAAFIVIADLIFDECH
jgi:hypothetical protein